MKVFERILYDELLTRTTDKIDTRQHVFLRNRSCNPNLLLFTESIARLLHEKIGTESTSISRKLLTQYLMILY